jgi:transposase
MDTTNEMRQKIITLHQTGDYSNRAISRQLNVHRTTVDRIIKLWNETGNVQSRRYGRPPTNHKLSVRTERALVRRSVSYPQETARQVRDLQGGEAQHVSVRTVQRVLRKYGRIPMRPVPAPTLNNVRKRQRLKWAKCHENWTAENWAKVSYKMI